VRKERGVVEVPHAGGVIGHDICDPSDVIVGVYDAEVSLMQCGETKEMLRRLCGRGGPFTGPYQRGCIVAEDGERAEVHVDVLGQNVLVGHNAGQFQVAVVDRSLRVRCRDQRCFNCGFKGPAPYQWASPREEPHPSHTGSAGVDGTDAGGLIRDDFLHPGGAVVEVVGQGGEVR
jgi:hypothetical protein